MLISLSAAAQTQSALPVGSVPYGTQYYIAPDGSVWVGSSTKKFRNMGTKSRVDSLLALKQGALTITTTGTSGASTLVGNTLNIPQYTGGGGGGGITSVTSSTADVTITNTTTAPVITGITSGTASGQLLRRTTGGGIGLSFIGGLEILPNNTTQTVNYYSGTSSYGGHNFYTQNSSALRVQINTAGDLIVNNLASGGTAPTTTGTKKMVVSDANGLFSFDNIPGGGEGSGTVTSFGKVDGYGVISSVSNPTTTPVHTIRLDTITLDKRYPTVLKDFYADSTVTNNTGTPKILYMDTLRANQFTKVGDKIHMKISGSMTASIAADQYLYIRFGGTDRLILSLTPSSTGTKEWEIDVMFIRTDIDKIRITGVSNLDAGSPPTRVKLIGVNAVNFNITNDIGIRASQSGATVGSITSLMGYIEFKPAAL